MTFNGQDMLFDLDPTSRPIGAGVRAQLAQSSPSRAAGDSVLDQVMGTIGTGAENERRADHHFFFGVRETASSELRRHRHNWVGPGFEFLELDLDCDPDGGRRRHRQVVVAVKLSSEVDDVGSAFLLTQQINIPDDNSLYQYDS